LCWPRPPFIHAAMQNVATLITDPRRADLVDRAPRTVGRVLAAAGAAIIDTNWLADHVACDVVFDGLSCDGAR